MDITNPVPELKSALGAGLRGSRLLRRSHIRKSYPGFGSVLFYNEVVRRDLLELSGSLHVDEMGCGEPEGLLHNVRSGHAAATRVYYFYFITDLLTLFPILP